MKFVMPTTPGVGSYNIYKDFSKGSPKFSFTKNGLSKSSGKTSQEKSFNVNDVSTPGPGKYNPKKLIDYKSPAFAIRGKPNDRTVTINLGPGSYEVSTNFLKPTSYSMSKSKEERLNITLSEFENLGPGKYNVFNQSISSNAYAKAPKIGKSKRNFHQISQTPGVGQYNLSTKFNRLNQSISISKAKREIKITENIERKGNADLPGPGRYNTSACITNNPGYTFSHDNGKKSQDQLPGPGHYNVSINATKPRTVGIKVSLSKREEIHKVQIDLPGPGKYNNCASPKSNSKLTSFSKSAKHIPVKEIFPGPGHYNTPKYLREFKQPT